jgi:hypothetical protein
MTGTLELAILRSEQRAFQAEGQQGQKPRGRKEMAFSRSKNKVSGERLDGKSLEDHGEGGNLGLHS